MPSKNRDYWFPAKRYGMGWGFPVRWQGWLVLALDLALVAAASAYLLPHGRVTAFVLCIIISPFLLLAIVYWKGEKPVRWRWGDKEK